MALLGVDDFKSKLRGGGARANLFKATLNFPAYAGGDVELTSFLCKTAQLPQSSTNSFVVPFRGRDLKVAGDRTFEDWTVTIINDTDFTIRDSFERWMNGMNAHSANTGLTNPVDYQADLLVDQFDFRHRILIFDVAYWQVYLVIRAEILSVSVIWHFVSDIYSCCY